MDGFKGSYKGHERIVREMLRVGGNDIGDNFEGQG